jgi:hypothetical protein
MKILAVKSVVLLHIARKERMKMNPTTSKVYFNVAHAFAPTNGIALCNLVVITTMMPTQVQTDQRNGSSSDVLITGLNVYATALQSL